MRFNPFNPQLPARPDFFVGREPEINEFEKFLSQTINGSPMNLSVTGNRGMGKTSILMKFEEMAKDNHCIVLRLSNYEGNISDIISLSDYINSNLKRELLSKRPLDGGLEKIKDWMSTLKPTVEWNDVSLSIEKQQVIQELLRQRLLRLWAEIKKEYKACVILIDEAESLERIPGSLTFLREVFQRVEAEAHYMLVLAGKLNFPERMSESFSPLNRFFPCSRLLPFNNQEIGSYVRKKLSKTGIAIDNSAVGFICEKSEGHPYVLVAICYLLFDSLRDEEIGVTKPITERAAFKIYAKLAEDFFSPMYHPITPKAKDVLKTICRNVGGLDFTFSDVVKWTGMEGNNISPYVQELFRKGIINKPERGKYQLFHKLFVSYVKNLE